MGWRQRLSDRVHRRKRCQVCGHLETTHALGIGWTMGHCLTDDGCKGERKD